jgi:hypothetical protein
MVDGEGEGRTKSNSKVLLSTAYKWWRLRWMCISLSAELGNLKGMSTVFSFL